MSLTMAQWAIVLLAAITASCPVTWPAACYVYCQLAPGEPLPTLRLRESPDAFRGLEGTFVDSREDLGLIVNQLGGPPRVLETSGEVRRITGPARDGTIAYVESDGTSCRLMLRDVDDDESPPRVLSTSERSSWFGCEWGEVTISPDGGRLAVVWGWPETERHRVSFLSLEDPSVILEGPADVAEPPQWFPDSERVLIVRWHAPDDDLIRRAPDEVIRSWRGHDYSHLPAIHVSWIGTRREELVCFGANPALSTTGRTFVVERSPGWWWLVDLESGEEHPLAIPGLPLPLTNQRGRVHALIDDDVVVYDGLPTEGTEQTYTRFWNHTPAPDWALRLWRISSGETMTLATRGWKHIGVSYGR